MTELGTAIAEQVILNDGLAGFLTRLSDPFWFQAFGAVMGMDWHSSGITTSVLGALKRGMNPRFSELGLMFCGGRGRHSMRTPDELREFSGVSLLASATMRLRLPKGSSWIRKSQELKPRYIYILEGELSR